MPLYEHVETTDDGERVTQRVRPADDSKNAAQLAAKAADQESGWREVDETAETPTDEDSAAAPSLYKAPVTTGAEVTS